MGRVSKREKILEITRNLLLLMALGAIFALSAAGAIYLAMRQSQVATPDLVGKPLQQAGEIAEKAGLKLHVKNSLYDDRYPPNTVSEQWPQAGMTVKRGQSLRVNVSLGPRPVRIEPVQLPPSGQSGSRPMMSERPPLDTTPITPRPSSGSETQSRSGFKPPGKTIKPEKMAIGGKPKAPPPRVDQPETKPQGEALKEKKPESRGSPHTPGRDEERLEE